MKSEYLETYSCSFCGEENEILVEPSAGSRQLFTEDCAVCCRPNLLHISISPEGTIDINAEMEE